MLKPWQALTISTLLHLLVLFGGLIRFPLDSPPPASITVTLKTIAPAPPAAARQTRQQPKPTAAKEKQQRLSAKNAARKETHVAATPDQTPPAKTEPPPQNAPAQAAQLVEAAGTPDYPADALQNGLQGCTLAAVFINDKGEVSEVRILHSDHPGVFDASVRDAQRHARYLPASDNGRTVAGRALAVSAFSLTAAGHRDCPLRYAPLAARINALPASASLDQALSDEPPQPALPASLRTVDHAH